MVTEMITLKLDEGFLKDIDGIVKQGAYHNRTEFIRNALREKVEETQLRETIRELGKLKGAAKSKTDHERYELARDAAFKSISKKLK